MARQDSRVIDGVTYTVTCVDARTALNLEQDIGGVLAGFAVAGASMAQQIRAALRSDLRAETIADSLGAHSQADGVFLKPNVWPEHFRGRVNALNEWILFLIEVNYANFTEGMQNLIARYEPAEEEKPSDAPS